MLKSVPLFILRLYQAYISPFKPATCRFYPSCSTYSIQSINKYGLLRGSFKSLLRILKCHPYHPGGYDPVP